MVETRDDKLLFNCGSGKIHKLEIFRASKSYLITRTSERIDVKVMESTKKDESVLRIAEAIALQES